jgi:putative endonuclease
MNNTYYVYIVSNYGRNVFYVGVTRDITKRIWQHRNKEGGKFTARYNCSLLMHFEEYSLIVDAISREKNLKNWRRGWKINLIRKENPDMIDLAADWF